MAEEFELSEIGPSDRPDVHRYLNIVRRRHMHFLFAAFFGWLVVWGAGWVLPARYKSSTLILVERPTMPKDYIEPNISDDMQDRLQSITQQILSRTRLLAIIDKLHLYGEGSSQKAPDDRVEQMRRDIDIDLVHGENQQGITGFTISYSAHDPHIAQQVTSQLTDLFIVDNLRARQQESESTTKFIEDQLEAARASLAEQEAKVRDYERKHEGELPSQQSSNIEILNGLQSQLQNEQDALNTAKQQGIYLQALIQQYRGLNGNSGNAGGGLTNPASIEQQLDLLRSKLANLSSHYTDRYPDIRNLKDEIAKTERMRDALLADRNDKSTHGEKPDDSSEAQNTQNHSESSSMLQLESQLAANRVEIRNREQAVAGVRARVNAYQARLNSEPVSEQELADLTRGYEQSKANYDDLLKKKNESEMATSMEQMEQGARFRMLDPPSLPMKPDFPNRIKLCGVGLGVGLALGILVAAGFEVMDDRLYAETEIKSLLPIAIISEIPEIVTQSDELSRKRRLVVSWVTASLVFVMFLAGCAFTYLHD